MKTLTSLDKEVRLFFLSDNRFGVSPLFLLLAITGFGGPESYCSLAIKAFGALGSVSPHTIIALEKWIEFLI